MWIALVAACSAPDPIDDPSATPVAPYDPLPWVDPRMATGGLGAAVVNINPGATTPWGLVHAGPDTRGPAGDLALYHCAGYHADDTHIQGFSQTHGHGIGIPDYGAVTLFPRDGWQPTHTDKAARAAPFSHDREWATPGHYAVELIDEGQRVDLAATPRGAHYTFTFTHTETPTVLIDLGPALDGVTVPAAALVVDGSEVVGDQRVAGGYSERFGGIDYHFSVVFDPAPIATGAWSDPADPVPGAQTATGTQIGAWLTFPPGTTEVHARIGVSTVDRDGARANRLAELPDLDGAARAAAAADAWRDALSGVRVRGGTDAERRIFHTSLYRTAIMPRRQDDVDGRYRGFDDQIHEGVFYSDFSLWDTFRTVHPWYELWQPELEVALLQSLTAMTAQGGGLPRWPMAHGNTGGMVGTPATQVAAGAAAKGLTGWDENALFSAALAAATGPVDADARDGITEYVSLGYVPLEAGNAAASKTLEYAWSDRALLGWAEARGDADAADAVRAGADSWRNTWDPAQGYFAARSADGTFAPLGSPFGWDEAAFTEGNATHYRYGAGLDAAGMVAVQANGDREAFLAELADYWDDVAAEPDDALPDDHYWHGNEPVLHVAWLASELGDPDLTAQAVDLVRRTRYDDTTEGLDGNDDAGTLSAWYLFAAIGLYPRAGTDTFVVGTPLFERVEIDRPTGTRVLRASGNGLFLEDVRLGETPVFSTVLRDAEWENEPVLHFFRSESPGGWAPAIPTVSP
jgi:predicted alpha-1,2-mannosidase